MKLHTNGREELFFLSEIKLIIIWCSDDNNNHSRFLNLNHQQEGKKQKSEEL